MSLPFLGWAGVALAGAILAGHAAAALSCKSR
jgi:hypothetical protein